mgnify:CR=1 FL=1
MRRFVMGDLHGAHSAMVQCLGRAGFDYENDHLIQLGDVADGHTGVFNCVEELLKVKNLIAIKGNHDVWFNEFIDTDFHPVFWQFGGKGTILSYLEQKEGKKICIASGSGFKTSLNASDIPPSHREFFNSQKPYHLSEDGYCFIHAGFDRRIAFDRQKESNYYWDRLLWTEALASQQKGEPASAFEMATTFNKIFIGHTATTKWGTDKPMTALNITNVDTGAGDTSGRRTIMDIDTGQYWQSDPILELAHSDVV